MASLRGFDADGDALQFGVRGIEGRDMLQLEPTSETTADVFLRRALDREVSDMAGDGKYTPIKYKSK